ncbi:MAG: hypothetical protein L6Q92_15300 [Phycisphaerae bacterium]|nr:hypothetical protein [Phycisphaerae bacterium]
MPGTVVTILSVNSGAAVTPGGPFNVQFTIETDDGDPIPVEELDRFSIYVSGRTTNYQRVIAPASDVVARTTVNADGSYTYTFPDPFPTTYLAPYNDSAFYGTADGELTGQALANGTYTVGIEARRDFMIDGETIRDAGDAFFDFVIGGGAPAPRQVVLESNCVQCHTRVVVHGENRFTVAGCVTCHTNGAEDRISADPNKETPGRTIQFADLIHALHRGVELPSVSATRNSADPYLYEVIGFGEAVHDYSHVAFPWMPGGTGFNQQTRNCAVCHGGAAQEANYYTTINRARCSSCHDDINFTLGTVLDGTNNAVINGQLTQADLNNPTYRVAPGSVVHTFTNDACVLCHGPGLAYDVRTVHQPPLSNDANTYGLMVQIQSVTGATGAGFFQAGDIPVVTFNVLNRNMVPVNIADLSSVNLLISGPTDNYQKVIPTSTSTTLSLKGNGGVPTSGVGPFTYTSTVAIPMTYPATFNNSANYDYAGGSGELSGQDLKPGTYTVQVYAQRQFTIDSVTYREASPAAFFDIRVGSAGDLEPYAGFVTDERCNMCHGDLGFHGNGRKGVAGCVMCHVGGAEDRPTPAMGQTQDPAPDTIDWKVMIHKIHAARELDVVRNGGAYDLIGFGDNVIDFSTAYLPVLPEGPAQCTKCHATDAWKEPVTNPDVRVWMVACTSCHDSASTAAHVELNTLNPGVPGGWTESCATCHGEGRPFSVEAMHAQP